MADSGVELNLAHEDAIEWGGESEEQELLKNKSINLHTSKQAKKESAQKVMEGKMVCGT